MRILQVDKFLRRQGGAASYMLDLAHLQRAAGHEVEFFAMADQRNQPARFAADFAPQLQTDPPPPGLRGRTVAAAAMIWNPAAARALGRVVDAFQPEVAHLHNIYHQLSPSVVRLLHRRGVRVVLTLHDYKLVCPTYRLLDLDGPCTACLDGRFRHAVERRCKDGSRSASAVLALETGLHRRFGAYDAVDAFVAPSRFLFDTVRAAGIHHGRLHHLPHFVDAGRSPRTDGSGTRFVYAGRLSPEKGVATLLRAVAAAGVALTIAGDGPQRAELTELAGSLGADARFVGALDRESTLRLVAGSRALVLPAQWYENQPMSVLEAMSCAVPVIATRLGGSPELVLDGETGLLVEPGEQEQLAQALKRLDADAHLARRLGAAGLARAEQDFSPGAHLERLDRLYRS